MFEVSLKSVVSSLNSFRTLIAVNPEIKSANLILSQLTYTFFFKIQPFKFDK